MRDEKVKASGAMKYGYLLLVCLLLLGAGGGCDAVTRHKVLTTIFDGVPSLPPAEQLCEEYAQEQIAVLRGELAATQSEGRVAGRGSSHRPYDEKNCGGCHDMDKRGGYVSSGIEDLCFVCHTDFIVGIYVHGPVAVADCLACHEPHSSRFPSLLKFDKRDLCANCHQESRVAAAMHATVMEKNMACVDCHDPHFGNVQYFLK